MQREVFSQHSENEKMDDLRCRTYKLGLLEIIKASRGSDDKRDNLRNKKMQQNKK